RHHRELHSFPTRRSSDLGERSEHVAITKEPLKLSYAAFSTTDKQYTVQNGTDYQAGIVLEDINSAAKEFNIQPNGKYQTANLTLDRKSTRLNSSHVKISY